MCEELLMCAGHSLLMTATVTTLDFFHGTPSASYFSQDSVTSLKTFCLL
jgi:hypothetical protein